MVRSWRFHTTRAGRDPPIRRSADPPIRRSADPPIRRSAGILPLPRALFSLP
jgi:hypothetical protein